jgi:hypothetical protein
MALKAPCQYNGHIENANLYYSNGGTLGLQLHLACEDGKITHTLWITEKTIGRVEETLLKIGVSKNELQDENALDNIGDILGGREVSFNTVAEEYQGREIVKVQWLNKPRQANGSSAAKMAAHLFAGRSQPAVPVTKPTRNNKPLSVDEWGLSDADVPY